MRLYLRIGLDTSLPAGTSFNYTKRDAETAASPMSAVLKLDGIRGIYHVTNFMAVEKSGDVEWDELLAHIEAIIPKK